MVKTSIVVVSLAVLVVAGLGVVQAQEPVEEWAAIYNGPDDGYEAATDIAVDDEGNVYVAGWSGRDLGYISPISPNVAYSDYVIIKYDSKGIEQWVRRYDFKGKDYDQLAQRYNEVSNTKDFAVAITLDSLGNVYITGYGGDRLIYRSLPDGEVSSSGEVTSMGAVIGNGERDYATIKYDSSGYQQWVRRYDGPGNSWDHASDIAVDGLGNVYVTGDGGDIVERWYDKKHNFIGPGERDYITIKYDGKGVEQWVRRYDGPGNSWDQATALVIDNLGNVFVTGSSATVKYDTNGNQLWAIMYEGGSVRDIAVDSLGNVYVAGDSATVKYDTNGNQMWAAKYSGRVVESLALDDLGNVYITGNSATIKYDSNGNQLWAIDKPAHDIAIDSLGNIYVAGISTLTKYDGNGNELWAAGCDEPRKGSISHDRVCDIALDDLGNVYVSGSLEFYYEADTGGLRESYDCLTIKYSQPAPPPPSPQPQQEAPVSSIIVVITMSLLAIAVIVVLVIIFRRRSA
jgi:hypothetical protein